MAPQATESAGPAEPARADAHKPAFGFLAALDPHLTMTNLRRAVVGLGAVVVVQAAAIGYLLMPATSDPATAAANPAPVAADYQPIGTTSTDPPPPNDRTGGPSTAGARPEWGGASASATEPLTQPVTEPVNEPVTTPVAPVAAGEPAPAAVGRVAIVAPIELQAFEGGALVGSTAGPLSLAAGQHTLELVNDELGYRSTQVVAVRAGRSTSVTIAVPSGRININAVPWAEVWIDGVAAGETPLANLSLSIGRHDILFRHPQLGERRETAVVKVDGIARVSVVFQQ